MCDYPLVSIIMGAYNCESTIRECLDSIIAQTYSNWEFIICNDASTDKTLEIINNYCMKDNRIKVINNKKNLRLAASLNNCLKVAKGKYIARTDADDKSKPERIEKQVIFLEEHTDIHVVGCNVIVFDEQSERGIRSMPEYPNKNVLLKGTPFAHPTIMMRKLIYDELDGYTVSEKTKRAQDLEMWFRFYEKGYKGYNMQEPLCYYRESVNDFSKRSLKVAVSTSKLFLDGYKRIGIPWYKKIWAIKPILAALLPNKFMYKYHSNKLE